MIIGAIMRTVRLRRLLNIAAPLRPDRGCLGMDFVGRVGAAAGPAKARSVNGLGWQTAIRGLFDPQRIFGAVANRGGGADGSAAPAGSQLRPLIDHPMTPAVLATSTSRPQAEG